MFEDDSVCCCEAEEPNQDPHQLQQTLSPAGGIFLGYQCIHCNDWRPNLGEFRNWIWAV